MPSLERELEPSHDGLEALTRISLRLPPAAAEALRQAAFASKLAPAVLARMLLLRALETGELPQPVAPSSAELDPDARSLLAALLATQSNLTQLAQHAQELGEPLARLSAPGGVLASLSGQVRALGLGIKAGSPAPSTAAALHAAADLVNALAKRLNADRQAVAIANWHEPLASLQFALNSKAN